MDLRQNVAFCSALLDLTFDEKQQLFKERTINQE